MYARRALLKLFATSPALAGLRRLPRRSRTRASSAPLRMPSTSSTSKPLPGSSCLCPLGLSANRRRWRCHAAREPSCVQPLSTARAPLRGREPRRRVDRSARHEDGLSHFLLSRWRSALDPRGWRRWALPAPRKQGRIANPLDSDLVLRGGRHCSARRAGVVPALLHQPVRRHEETAEARGIGGLPGGGGDSGPARGSQHGDVPAHAT